ncbi:hypothetical protein QOZ80_5AG0362060 [Eleusine coracana subsp. coracana]|nr:hypothetical protein QOZ80_5AG0362060 [Eleusine coracana subsp. coracana]
MTYAQVEQHFKSMEDPSAQERIDCVVSLLLSILPPPLVPAPDVDSGDDSSSDSEASDASDVHGALSEAAPGDGEDHISRLLDLLLTDIIHRLPTKDAGRTAVLSTHWRRVWAATPLLVDDAHLRADGSHGIPIVRAVSRCVAAHPGPIAGVRITGVPFIHHEYSLRRLVAALADKDVKDLILVNRPWPLDMPLPDDILRCASLERGTSALQVAVDWMSMFEEVVVQDAPCLKRLLLHTIVNRRPVRIVRAPKLEVLGFLDLNMHDLEIGGTVIRAGVNVGTKAMVPSLKILAVMIQFGCNREAKMLPTLLKCFPHLETLHVVSVPSESPDCVRDLRFWETQAACECLESHLRTVVYHGSISQMHEIGFLKFILREGKVLKTVGLVCGDEKVKNFRASGGTNGQVSFRMVTPRWSFQSAIDSSLNDPFYLVPSEA